MTDLIYVPFTPTHEQAICMNGLLDETCALHGFVGGVGAGKTQVGCQVAIDVTHPLPGNEIAVVRKARVDLEATTYKEFCNTLPPGFIIPELCSKEKLRVAVRSIDPRYPSFIDFKGLDDRNRWGSTQYSQIIIDEASEVDPNDITYLIGRLRHKLPPGINPRWKESAYYCKNFNEEKAKKVLLQRRYRNLEQVRSLHPELEEDDLLRFIFFISNRPPDAQHWINILMREGTINGAKINHKITTADTHSNAENLPPTYLKTLEALPELDYERLVEGKEVPGVEGPPCLPDFSKEVNTFDGPWPTYPVFWIRGWDPGFRYAACVWMTIIDGVIRIWGESIQQKGSLKRLIVEQVKPKQRECHIDCDFRDWFDHHALNAHGSQSDSSNADIMRAFGFNPRSKPSGPKTRQMFLNDLCKAKRLLIHKRFAPHTLTGARGGWYLDDKGEPAKPNTVYQHLWDSAGYGIYDELGALGANELPNLMRTKEEEFQDPTTFVPRLYERQMKLAIQRNGKKIHFPGMGSPQKR